MAKRKSIYLGGSMSEFIDIGRRDLMNGWRDDVTKTFEAAGFDVYNPSIGNFDLGWIYQRDFRFVMDCDIVMFNFLGAKRASFGSIMEVGWAWEHHKLVPICMEPDNVHQNFFVTKCATIIVPTLEEVVEAVLKF